MSASDRSEAPPSGFAPVLLVEVELARPLPSLKAGAGRLGIPYGSAQCLVRLHGSALGFATAALPAEGLDGDALAALIWAQLGEQISAHLRADGIQPPPELDSRGLPPVETPPCREALDGLPARAPFLSVVIPTKNRPDSVAQTLDGIANGRYPRDRYEVIVVDNASGEDTPVEMESLAVPDDIDLSLVREPVPGGSNARNRGIKEARGEIVVCADDDILVDSDWLARMALPFVEDPAVGGVAGLTMPSELETPAQLWFEGFGGFMRGFERRVYDIASPPADRPLFPFTVGDLGSGQNMAFRRSALEEVGGFDPALGTATPTLAGEDLELMLRVLVSGRRVVYEPRAIVRHEHQRELGDFRDRVWGYGVGLTACLTKASLANPRLLGMLVRRLPRGVLYALSPASAKNEGKQADYPRELTRLELRGMAYGPVAYLRSRRRLGGRRRRATRTGPPAPDTALRALIVTDSHPPLIGGANRSVELLTRRLVERGHSVVVATAWQEGLPASEQTPYGVRVRRIRDLPSRARWISEDPFKHNPPPFPDPQAVSALRRIMREFRPDIVHAYGWLAHSAAAALRPGEAPLLLTARDYGNFCAVRTLVRKGTSICSGPGPAKCLECASWTYGGAKGPVAAASVLGVRPLLRRRVTAVHSVSHYVAGRIESHLAVPGAIARVIPNFIEEPSGEAVDEAVLARLPERPFILYVGAFRMIKGIAELLAAHRALDDPPPLVLVGTRAPDTPHPFPPDGVTVIEDVPHPTVMAIWERALFGVLPTRAPEALGNVVLEAMSKGRPMIGTRPGGQEDLIEDGVNGILVPSGDPATLAGAMARLSDDAELREQLGRRALERARDFRPEVVMPQLEALYLDTVARFREQSR